MEGGSKQVKHLHRKCNVDVEYLPEIAVVRYKEYASELWCENVLYQVILFILHFNMRSESVGVTLLLEKARYTKVLSDTWNLTPDTLKAFNGVRRDRTDWQEQSAKTTSEDQGAIELALPFEAPSPARCFFRFWHQLIKNTMLNAAVD